MSADTPPYALAKMSLRARYCICTVPSETPRGTVDDMEPHAHREDCPVAPVPGVHGGMRLYPWRWYEYTPFGGGLIWKHYDNPIQLWCTVDDVVRVAAGNTLAGIDDLVLYGFFVPPKDSDSHEIPVDNDPELEGVAARATHEPGRWSAR